MDMMDLKLLKHPSVTANVINALDNKGKRGLISCWVGAEVSLVETSLASLGLFT